LANSKQATKRARQAEKRRTNNRWQKSRMFTNIKRVLKLITEKNKEKAQEEYKVASSLIDKLASKGLIHKNKAARHKSRLSKQIKQLTA